MHLNDLGFSLVGDSGRYDLPSEAVAAVAVLRWACLAAVDGIPS